MYRLDWIIFATKRAQLLDLPYGSSSLGGSGVVRQLAVGMWWTMNIILVYARAAGIEETNIEYANTSQNCERSEIDGIIPSCESNLFGFRSPLHPPLNWNCQRLPRRLFDDGVRLKTTVPYSRHSHSRIVLFPSLMVHLVLCFRVESWDWFVLVKLEALQCLQLPTYPQQHPPASIHYRRI